MQLNRRHGFRAALAVVTICCTLATTTAIAGAQDDDEPETTIAITGHGWGHGRGMSQYGALGYALNFGWSSSQILDHYYGGTTAGTVANSLQTIRIESASDKPTVAQVDSGVVVLIDDDNNVTHVSNGGALRLTAVSGGFTLADAPTCAGPFVDREGVIDAETLRISTADTPEASGPLTGSVGEGTIVMGDWDGDGDDEAGTANGTSWTLYNGSLTNPAASVRTTFEMPAGIAVSGDWDGDGDDTAGVFADGTWHLGNGTGNTAQLTFGQAGDTPVVGDWDGDGNDDLGVRRGNTWLLSPGGGADVIEFDWGWLVDTPLVGDWDGDGIDDVGLLRQREWFRRPRIGANLGAQLPKITYANKLHYLVGDWDGDGIDEPGRHDDGVITLPNPNGEAGDGDGGPITPRLDPNLPLAETIQRCVSDSEQRYYRGELRAVHNNGNQRTVNAVNVESYLRAVVPLEMPASWALLGDGAGAEALQSQAVSARSYSLAENRTSYARTCDTISCQVYGGRAVRRNGTLSTNENELANAAIASTAGVVRIRDGEVARTEFSSSTGGWTAGGVFPAVEDLGDAVDRNPNYNWETSVEIASIEGRFSDRRLDKVYVSERNGLGQDGGRVEEVTLVFGEETFTMTGNEFRRAFRLKSDWYTIDWERESPLSPCICPEKWPDQNLLDDIETFTG